MTNAEARVAWPQRSISTVGVNHRISWTPFLFTYRITSYNVCYTKLLRRNYFSDIHIDCILVTENTKVLKLLDMVGMTDLFTVVPDKTDIPSRV